jgi:hypothetical protein
MKTTQPPVFSEQDLAGYRAAAKKRERLIQWHEDDLITARRETIVDAHRSNQIRSTLWQEFRASEAGASLWLVSSRWSRKG